MTRLAVLDMLGEIALLGMFAYAGTIPASVVIAFGLAGLCVSAGFFLIMKRGWNQRYADRGLLIPQILAHGLLQCIFLLIVPQLSILFMLALLLLSGYAVLEFSARQFTVGWMIYAATTGIALLLVGDRFAYPGTSALQIGLVWGMFALALRLLTLVNVQFGHMRAALSEKNRQLHISLQQIEEMASHDHLTGVCSRRNLVQMLEAEIIRSVRTDHEFCVVMLDLDHFKLINDNFGHPVGDVVLKAVCDVAVKTLRAVDRVGRLGGEEFGILMPETSMAQALLAMERIRTAIARSDWAEIAPGLSVTFSAGVAAFMVGDTLESIIKRADDAMYRAKHAGRNCIMAATVHFDELQHQPAATGSAA